MGLPRIIKPAGKDTTDMHGTGGNKVAKWDKKIAGTSGKLIRLGRAQPDEQEQAAMTTWA